MDTKELANSAVKAVKEHIEKALSGLSSRMDGFESRLQELAKTYSGLPDLEVFKALLAELPAPKDGKDGENGKSVTIDDLIPVIRAEIEHLAKTLPTPKDGIDGRDGRDGIDGRDSLDIEILPMIDEEKTYPRDTYAMHKGGLFRASANTKGMQGWECLVDGLADIQIDYDGEREFTVSALKASGEVVKKTVAMPIVLDKGVFKENQEYKRNDGITFAGSFWIAQKDNPQGKPGEGNSDFRLAVKRGRDANTPVKVGK